MAWLHVAPSSTKMGVPTSFSAGTTYTSIKADGKETPRPVHPSNVLVTKLDLTDPYRKRKLEGKSK